MPSSKLIRAGADVKAANRLRRHPLPKSLPPTAARRWNRKAVGRQRHLTPTTRCPKAGTVLMTAARTGDAAAVKVLVEHGAKVNATEGWKKAEPR